MEGRTIPTSDLTHLRAELAAIREARKAPPLAPPPAGTQRSKRQSIQARAAKRRKANGWRLA